MLISVFFYVTFEWRVGVLVSVARKPEKAVAKYDLSDCLKSLGLVHGDVNKNV